MKKTNLTALLALVLAFGVGAQAKVMESSVATVNGQPVLSSEYDSYLEGVLVVGTSPVSTAAGEVESPAKQAGIRMGDVILAVNGQEVEDSDHLGELVNAAQGPVLLVRLQVRPQVRPPQASL